VFGARKDPTDKAQIGSATAPDRGLRRRWKAPLAATLVLSVGLSGCLEPTAPQPDQFWEGALVSVSEDLPIEGTISIVAQAFQTQAAVVVSGAEADTTLTWSIRFGTCAGDGEILGAAQSFLPIDVGPDGEGISYAVFQGRLTTTLQLSGFVLAEGEVVACAGLAQVDRLSG
jgi:hypothetical protein